MKLKDFLTSLAKKAGYDTESATAKPFFDGIPDSDVPDEVQRGVDNSLISITDAKNNHPEIRNHYRKQSLDGVDGYIKNTIEHFRLDPEVIEEIEAAENTYKRLPILVRAVAAQSQKKSGVDPKDKAAIQLELDNLHKAVAEEKAARAEEKKSFENQRIQDRVNVKKNVLFSGVKTIHDELDPEIRYNILDSQLQKELQDNQAKFAFDEQGNFTLIKNDGTNLYGENHQQIKPVQFVEQLLAKNKQLKVSTPAPTGAPNNGNPPVTAGGDKGNNGNASLIERNNQAARDYNAGMATVIANGVPVQ